MFYFLSNKHVIFTHSVHRAVPDPSLLWSSASALGSSPQPSAHYSKPLAKVALMQALFRATLCVSIGTQSLPLTCP